MYAFAKAQQFNILVLDYDTGLSHKFSGGDDNAPYMVLKFHAKHSGAIAHLWEAATEAETKGHQGAAKTPATTTSASSSSAIENPVTNLGMYSATPGTQPPTPLPTSGRHHPTPPQHGRFNERLVHQIYFKTFAYSNSIQELWIMEIPVTGYPRTRDPEHFFYRMTGDWDWSQRTADYWRYFFGVPMRHGGNPFADYYPPDMEHRRLSRPSPPLQPNYMIDFSRLRYLEWDLVPLMSPAKSWTT